MGSRDLSLSLAEENLITALSVNGHSRSNQLPKTVYLVLFVLTIRRNGFGFGSWGKLYSTLGATIE